MISVIWGGKLNTFEICYFLLLQNIQRFSSSTKEQRMLLMQYSEMNLNLLNWMLISKVTNCQLKL